MNVKRWIVVVSAALCASLAASAFGWNRLQATQFATLPPGTAHPEGITADGHGNFYVADFDVSGNTTVGTIVVFDHNGRLLLSTSERWSHDRGDPFGYETRVDECAPAQ